MADPDVVLFIDTQTEAIVWKSGTMWLGNHLRLVNDDGGEPGILVVHSRGYSVGPRHGRVYVPASFHVFKVLDSDDAALHVLEHLTSFPARIRDAWAPSTGLHIYWRPYPDPIRAIGNGGSSHPNPEPLSDGSTNLN